MADKSNLQKAKEIVKKYQITIIKDGKGGFIGSSIELPAVSVKGKTAGECYSAVEKALVVVVVKTIAFGKHGKRTKQVNVRLTSDEKILLVRIALGLGFKGVGDFLRTTALEQARLNR